MKTKGNLSKAAESLTDFMSPRTLALH